MNIQKRIADAINEQINAELWSSYFYLSMAIYWREQGRQGIANWFEIQAKEEVAHAQIFIKYVHDRNGIVRLQPITDVKQEWSTVLESFADTLVHEQKVTSLIHNLYTLAEEEKDYATRQMLGWYIAEQVEEEANVQEIIDNLNLIGDSGVGLLQIDRELAARTFTAPSVSNN